MLSVEHTIYTTSSSSRIYEEIVAGELFHTRKVDKIMNTSKSEKHSEIVLFLIMVFIAGLSGYLFYNNSGSTMQVVHFLMFSIFGMISLSMLLCLIADIRKPKWYDYSTFVNTICLQYCAYFVFPNIFHFPPTQICIFSIYNIAIIVLHANHHYLLKNFCANWPKPINAATDNVTPAIIPMIFPVRELPVCRCGACFVVGAEDCLLTFGGSIGVNVCVVWGWTVGEDLVVVFGLFTTTGCDDFGDDVFFVGFGRGGSSMICFTPVDRC